MNDKITIYIAFLGFVIILALSYLFCVERIAFSDMSYMDVLLLFDKKPCPNYYRPGSTLLQFIPLLMDRLGFSLYSILQMHSVSFIIYQLVGFLFVAFYQKQIKIATSILFYFFLLNNHTFYWCQSEYQQGFVFLAILSAFLKNNLVNSKLPLKFWTLLLLQSLWISTYHPLIIIPLLFTILLYFSLYENWNKRTITNNLIILCLVLIFKFALSSINPYEAGKASLLLDFKHNLFSFYKTESFHSFISFRYILFYIFSIILLLGLIKKKDFFKMVLLSIVIAYLLLIFCTHNFTINFYSESMILPVGFMLGLLIIEDNLITKRCFNFLLLGVVFIGSFHIYQVSSIYIERKNYLLSLIDKYTGSSHPKALLNSSMIDEQKLLSKDYSCYESLLLTALRNPKDCRVLMVTDNVENYRYFESNNSDYLAIYSIYKYDEIPQKHFNLAKGTYIYIKE